LSSGDRVTEAGSVDALRGVLRGRTEDSVLIVCHWGVIKALCGEEVDNCTLVECERDRVSGQLRMVQLHVPPCA
jgi:hypothetical protein